MSLSPVPVPDPRPRRGALAGPALPVLCLLAALALGAWGLGGWLMNDDEGNYLYAAWRISLGEMPYRDFTLVQTPLAFGLIGGLFALTGPSVGAARALSFLFVLGAAALLYAAGRRYLGLTRGGATAGAAIFLLNKHIFFLARSFLPDNLMLLGAAAMLWAALRAEAGPEAGSGKAAFLAGVFGGLSALAKLNGAFFFAGYGLFLVAAMARRETRGRAWAKAWRAAAGFGLGFGLPYGLMLALVPGTFEATVGFHAAPGGAGAGAGAGAAFSLGETAARIGQIVGNHNYGLFALAIVGIVAAIRRRGAGRDTGGGAGSDAANRRPAGLLLLATAAAACLPVLLPGKYFLRYVLPAFLPLALFFGMGLEAAWRARRRPLAAAGLAVSAALVALCLGPTLSPAKLTARDEGTRALARLIGEATKPGDFVFGDDPFLNFLARRACPPNLVDVSGAMVRSGRITAARIERECEASRVALVFVERGHSAHHLAALPDAAAFQAYLGRAFRLRATVKREFLDVDVYVRNR